MGKEHRMFVRVSNISPPVFFITRSNYNLYYAPRFLVKVHRDYVPVFEKNLKDPKLKSQRDAAFQLKEQAKTAGIEQNIFFNKRFKPLCLSLNLTNVCNMSCNYCFTNEPISNQQYVTEKSIIAGANLVARNCAKYQKPFSIVFHGGGESILAWKIIDNVNPYFKRKAREYRIPLFRYVATNAVMSPERANWVSKSFELVGISCDGPPEIQSRQRPLKEESQMSSSFYVERTSKILSDAGVPLLVRATITDQTVDKQAEICDYICTKIKPKAINVEPVYLGGRTNSHNLIKADQIDNFVQSYMEAKSIASIHGIEWRMSDSRLNEIHGAYCNIFRQVLSIVPGDVSTTCFKTTNSKQAHEKNLIIGKYFQEETDFDINDSHIEMLQAGYTIPDYCFDCFLVYQCTHNCPNSCPLINKQSNDFLCKLLKSVITQQLIQLGSLLTQDKPVDCMWIPC